MNEEKKRQQNFKTFLDWFNKNIKGNEKKEDKLFFNELLKAFGNPDLLSSGARTEVALKKKSGSTGFADFLWEGRVLIELKKRGTNLAKHYQQAAEYWMMTTPKPSYMVLCNFDEFWIYDFNIQMNDPVHKLNINNLQKEYTALAFLFPKQEAPYFNNNFVQVTEDAAKIIGEMFYSLQQRGIDPFDAQRFVLQLVVALFSEDTGLIPQDIIRKILKSAIDDPDGKSDLTDLNDLFTAMATQQKSKKINKYSNIPYFNGGIFNTVKSFKLKFNEIHQLAEASKQDWSKVRPSIFGAIFEASIDQKERHDKGIHYTSELDIQKIIGPTIVRPFRKKIEKAKTKQQRLKILEEVRNFKVLDPACGSGNFLYIAFRELRRLEFELIELTEENFNPKNLKSDLISPKNFYGIDTNIFGLELAKLALSIGRKLSSDELGINDKVLPFENLDNNFIEKDALFVAWPEVDAIIGNPPFLGGRNLRRDLGDEYVDKLYKRFHDVSGQPDYCVFWFQLAHQQKKTKFFGLVGTNSIAQGFSRDAGLNFITKNGGFIHDAISSQEWSGEAAVHVSIVNWSKEQIVPLFLDGKVVKEINNSLKSEISITDAKTLSENQKISFESCQLGGKGFIVPQEKAKEWIKEDKNNRVVLKPMIDGTSLVNPNKRTEWVIDFNELSIELASKFKLPFEHVKKRVKPTRDLNKVSATKNNWWRFRRRSPDMRLALQNKKLYFALPKVAKYTNFQAIDISILPCEANMVVASDDFYILGVLNSKLHRDWVKAQSSTLKGDTRYTNTTCFETFPFLWNAPKQLKDPVRKVMKKLNAYRVKTMKAKEYGITKLYNDFFGEPSSQLYKLHAELDKAVAKVYGWKKFDSKKNYNKDLYDLNLKLHKQELAKEAKIAKAPEKALKRASVKRPKDGRKR